MTRDLAATIVSLIDKPNPTILDIGSNDGTDTMAFLDLFPGARVYSFEPDPRAISRYRAKVKNIRAQLFPVAIGATNGRTVFYQSDGYPGFETDDMPPWDLSGSIHQPTGHKSMHPWCKFNQQIEVPLLRLDTWTDANDIHEVDFIWADVQGAEGDLILGGRRTLEKTRFFFIEYSNQELYEGQLTLAAILSLLPDYEVVNVYPDDVLLRNKVQ